MPRSEQVLACRYTLDDRRFNQPEPGTLERLFRRGISLFDLCQYLGARCRLKQLVCGGVNQCRPDAATAKGLVNNNADGASLLRRRKLETDRSDLPTLNRLCHPNVGISTRELTSQPLAMVCQFDRLCGEGHSSNFRVVSPFPQGRSVFDRRLPQSNSRSGQLIHDSLSPSTIDQLTCDSRELAPLTLVMH